MSFQAFSQSACSSTSSTIPSNTSDDSSLPQVCSLLKFMEHQKIWPNGLRYLWTDAHGVILLVSLYFATGNKKYFEQAEHLIEKVDHVLGRRKGYRIGEEPDRYGQYFHYLTKWVFSLYQMSFVKSSYRDKAIQIIKDIHPHFVTKRGVIWKMKEDLSDRDPNYGFGGLDHFDGYVIWKLVDGGEKILAKEIEELKDLVEASYPRFSCTQDLGLGEILWLSHFFPEEPWAKHVRNVAVATLDKMWVPITESKGYFKRDLHSSTQYIIAFSNFGVGYGLQSQKLWPERVASLHKFFENWKSEDEYDYNAITHVMHCNTLFPGVMLKEFQRKPPINEFEKEETGPQHVEKQENVIEP